MKKWLLVFLIFLCSCSYTGNVVVDPNQNFIDAENELMNLALSYTVSESPLIDSFKQQFGERFALKVYSTKFLFFDDQFVWYSVSLNGNQIIIQKVDEPTRDWYFEVNVEDVPEIVQNIQSLSGISDVISLATDIGTEPDMKSLEIINWLRSNL